MSILFPHLLFWFLMKEIENRPYVKTKIAKIIKPGKIKR